MTLYHSVFSNGNYELIFKIFHISKHFYMCFFSLILSCDSCQFAGRGLRLNFLTASYHLQASGSSSLLCSCCLSSLRGHMSFGM